MRFQVVDGLTGSPVTGATVRVRNPRWALIRERIPVRTVGPTDREGFVSIKSLRSAEDVEFNHPDYSPASAGLEGRNGVSVCTFSDASYTLRTRFVTNRANLVVVPLDLK